MRKLASGLLLAAIAVALVLLVGCDGEDTESGTPAAGSSTVVEATTEAPAAEATAASPAGTDGGSSPASGPGLSEEEARDKLSRATILMDDLESGYTVMNDEYTDNAEATASQSDATTAQAFLDGAGRVLGHAVVYTAEDVTGAALSGRSVAFFASVDAFQDSAGAGEYYALSSGLLSQGAGIEGPFADLFADPADVEVSPAAFSDIGDESQAFTLKGETEAEGQLYPLTALVAVVRQGQVTMFVGSVLVVMPPDVREVEDLARLLVDRIDEEF